MAETRPVLIVGAGPTGLTAAMELSRFGIPVRLVEKAKAASDTSRALAVQARTLELMAQRGLGEKFLATGRPGHGAAIYSTSAQMGNRDPLLGRVNLREIESTFNFILMIPQSETERILRDQVERQGVTVEWGTEMIAMSQAGERAKVRGVKAILRKPNGSLEEVDAAYMISAEGAHSSIRTTLGLEFSGRSLAHNYALADLHIDANLSEDEISMFLPEQGLMGVFPMGNRRFRMIAMLPDGEVYSEDAPPTLEQMQTLWGKYARIDAKLYDMYWSSHFRINSRMVETLRRDRIFLGGDSAHIHSPAGGQGMNVGIHDMINLGWKLALAYRGHAADPILDTYQQERLPIIRRLVETTEGATDAFTADNGFVHSLVRMVLPKALEHEAVQKRAAKMISEVGTNYAGSPLTGKGSCGELKAGDRFFAKDLSPDHFTVVVGTKRKVDGDALAARWNGRVECRGDIAPAELEEQVMLVRPDGYTVMMTAQMNDVEDWLRRWLTQA